MVRSAWMVGMWALGVGGGCLICIARGSRVLTPSGARAIEALAVGDAVYSIDVRSGELVATRVVARRSGVRECMALRVAGRRLVLTSTHPVYDAAAGSYRQAGALVEDDAARLLVVGAGPMPIDSVERYVGLHEVHDISVEHPLHNFVVEGVIVHNKSDDASDGDYYDGYEDDDDTLSALLDTPGSVPIGTEVKADGSGSTVPDDEVVRFRFTLDSIPPGSKTTLSNGELTDESSGSVMRFTPDIVGTYRIVLDVFDPSDEASSVRDVDLVDAYAPERMPADTTDAADASDGSSSSSNGSDGTSD